MGTMLKIKPTAADDIDAALELVIDLAFQNTVDRYDNPNEYRRQMRAIRLVEETFIRDGNRHVMRFKERE
jgi:hypothetical protein